MKETIVMPMKVKEIEKEALLLSSHERALLAEHLIGSLEPDEDLDAERAWIEEAERRYQDYKAGKVKTIPSEQVFKNARMKLK
jgi:putative addiction module component (TIGR02574 family)